MTKRMTRKKATSAAKPSVPKSSSTPFEFDFSKFISSPELKTSPPSKKKKEINVGAKASSPMKNLSNVSDLKNLASSQMDQITRHVDRSHAEIVKEFEASESRLHKRLKLQTQGCQQVADEAEKEYRKMSDRIGEGRDAMTASYSEFIRELQASSSRVFKASLPELSQSFGKAIDSLKSRYGAVESSAR